jgi:hypothetical protein
LSAPEGESKKAHETVTFRFIQNLHLNKKAALFKKNVSIFDTTSNAFLCRDLKKTKKILEPFPSSTIHLYLLLLLHPPPPPHTHKDIKKTLLEIYPIKGTFSSYITKKLIIRIFRKIKSSFHRMTGILRTGNRR